MKNSDKPKLVIAVVLLLGAAAVLAWYFGVFGNGGVSTPENAPPATPHAAGGPHAIPGAGK